ncbi:outer membrane lipid asymmetry maintenance protein MlaD [Aliidiomarina sanyensis]|uniref:Outer membrane lipid asymmetry maintenance protein MlaD n=1 Tax=Aliidiomarina sanyensis TaxID=1249555 RepID=A0A432WIA9_9GAMM|nr:outer membrane lipid asymmetry maintenance protein MlaD [Aliidiomarina sanyensis]RUO33457.1 outer membrane lipid asymmetry maintenance protein MlaD [Aliidiomarina sanyensis]
MEARKIEFLVGVFVTAAIAAIVFLAMQVANNTDATRGETYTLYAKFDNIGGLKVRSPVKVGGVVVGRVSRITLDREYFEPLVEMRISVDFKGFPDTSSASILTSGLLGEQYIGLEPGFIDEDVFTLEHGDYIYNTNSAIVLENLIGQFLFSQGGD